MSMAALYEETENFAKAVELFRLALDGKQRSLGKDHEGTKM